MNTTTGSAHAVETQGLGKDFGRRTVLDDVSLNIERGSVLGLIGRNGAGKSTLLRCMLGLLRPSRGQAQVFGTAALGLGDAQKSALAYVPQQPDSFEWMRVDELLAFIGNLYANWDDALAKRLLQRWDLSPRARLSVLSPGQRQQVALIRALAARPALLVLDEPAAALDPVARRDLLREIVTCASEQEATVIFSSHIISDLERVASHVAFLHEGRLRLQSALDDLKDQTWRVCLPDGTVLSPTLAGELSRRRHADGSWSLLVRREMDDIAQDPLLASAHPQRLSLEDLFVELAG